METETTQSVQAKASKSTGDTKGQGKDDIKVEVKAVNAKATVEPSARTGLAGAIIQRNVLWALAAGVMPIPIFDLAAITGVEIKMLKELSDLYEVSFREDLAAKILGSLIGSLGSVGIGGVIGAGLAKLVPFVGTTLGAISVPIFAGAFTHATGKVFVMHFESGGTMLDFDPHQMRTYFKQEFEKAKETVAHMHKEEQAKAGAKT